MNPIDIYCMANQDRSDRVRWLLEELSVPYKDHYLKKKLGDMNTPEYRALNPMGRVPTINDNGTVVWESAAICLYLADRFRNPALAPAPEDPERPAYLQWMVWSVGSLECVIARMFTHTNTPEETKATHQFVKEQCEILKLALLPVLSQQDYILKSGFSAADIMLGAILPGAWDYIVEPYPPIKFYMQRLMAREAAVRAQVFAPPPAH